MGLEIWTLEEVNKLKLPQKIVNLPCGKRYKADNLKRGWDYLIMHKILTVSCSAADESTERVSDEASHGVSYYCVNKHVW